MTLTSRRLLSRFQLHGVFRLVTTSLICSGTALSLSLPFSQLSSAKVNSRSLTRFQLRVLQVMTASYFLSSRLSAFPHSVQTRMLTALGQMISQQLTITKANTSLRQISSLTTQHIRQLFTVQTVSSAQTTTTARLCSQQSQMHSSLLLIHFAQDL